MRGTLRALVVALGSLLVVAPGLGLVGSADAASSSFQLRVSASATRAAARPAQGAVVAGAAYVFVGPTSHIARVAFWIDDSHRLRTPRRTDTTAPFDLVGGTRTTARPWWTSGLPEGTHHLTAQVTTTAGRHFVLQAAFTVRNTPRPPTAPHTVSGNRQVTVFWHSAGGTTAGFNVYRGTTVPVARTKPLNGKTPLGAGRRSFVDTTAVGATTYRYVVVAVSAHGLLSKPSATVSGRRLAQVPTPPPPPKSVVATPASAHITVAWQTGGGTTNGFNVFRSTSADVPLTDPINGSTPLRADAMEYPDAVSTPGTYFYVVQAVSADGVSSDPSDVARATFGAADIRVTAPQPVLYASRNAATAATGSIRVTNMGDAPLTVSGADLTGGSFFKLAQFAAFTLAGGESQNLTFSFKPTANGPQRTTLTVHSDDPADPDATLGLGGLAIDSVLNGEPSLQWIIAAYGLNADDGDPHPTSYPLDATSLPPSDGVLATGFTRHDAAKPVRVTALAAFVSPDTAGDVAMNPGWGWAPLNTAPGAATATYDARRDFLGTTYTISPTGSFGLWVQAEGVTLRTDTNSAVRPRFIAFPVAGSPGTYVLADDTTGGIADDWNDLPLLVENVDVTGG